MDDLLEKIVAVAADAVNTGPKARHAAKRMLLDSIGCAIGAYEDEVPEIVRNLALRYSHPAGAHVFGLSNRVTAEMAAFANGVMVRYLDLNDAYGSTVGIGHPSDYIAPILAAAEIDGVTGSKVLNAIVLSYEIFCRLTDATSLGVDKWDHVLNGAVASAVGVAHILDLNPDQLRNAISLSLVPNVALQVTRLSEVSMWKGCASANAGRNALFAVHLARAGISGPSAPYSGRGGLFAAIGSAPILSSWERDQPAILDCNIKRFPAGYFSQSAIQAALDLREQVTPANEIRKVEVGTFAFGLRVMAGDPEKWRPRSRETADHSLPFVVAHALAHGSLSKTSFTVEAIRDLKTLRLLDVLSVTENAECQAAWPESCMNRISIELSNGEVISTQVRNYLGHSANPMSDQQLEEKFRDSALPALGIQSTKKVIAAIWALDSAPDLQELFESIQISMEVHT
jgi:2-methylcitrate dehydratase